MFFYKLSNTLDILVDFFNADNEGPSRETLTELDVYVDLKNYCNYVHVETTKLVCMYYENMINIQKSVKSTEFGRLLCKAYYERKQEILHVEGI
jgi:hypothetical protein